MEIVRFLIFGIPLVALGAFVDRMLTRRHKVKLHEGLLRVWLKIAQTSFPDLGPRIARRAYEPLVRNIETRQMGPTLIKLMVLSWLLTSVTASIGTFMDGAADANPYTWLPIFPVYFVSGYFDALTLLITCGFLRLGAQTRSWGTVGLVGLNAILATAIAIASLPLLAWAHNEAYARNWPGSGDTVKHLTTPISELGFTFEEALLPEIEKHLREKGPIPFEFEREDWSVPGMSAKRIKSRMEFRPGTTAEIYRMELQILRRHLRLMHETADDYYYVGKYSFGEFYTRNLMLFFTDLWKWSPKMQGSYKATGNGWTTTANAIALPSGRWSFILVSATTLLPTAILAFGLMLLASLKLVREAIAWTTMYLIERTTEDDPRKSPEKFLPFTMLTCVLGLCLYAVRELESWVASILI